MVRFTGAEPVVFAIAIGCDALLAFAHLALCADAILRREACDIIRVGGFACLTATDGHRPVRAGHRSQQDGRSPLLDQNR
jgi:hypothetical protein